MATLSRRPLAPRPLHLHIPSVLPQLKTMRTSSVSVKRARSPDIGDNNAVQATPPKRAKAAQPSPLQVTNLARDMKDREARKVEREAQKAEFRLKYTRAFPTWVFHFDLDVLDPESAAVRRILENKVSLLGARIDDFFSNEVTHLITNQLVPTDDVLGNKENVQKGRPSPLKAASTLQSPIKLRARPPDESSIAGYDHLVKKAIGFGMKIWSTSKLDSVLERCLVSNTTDSLKSSLNSTRTIAPTLSTSNTVNTQHRPLSRLLQSERFHGTHERDPTQKRHDFQYFSRSSYFVLVEDLRQELATIAALEYTATKGSDGKLKPTWPVLHCHPYARGPFIEYDEREKRRWERSQLAESRKAAEKENKRALVTRKDRKKVSKMELRARKGGDLRRSVSMSNLHRRTAHANASLHGMVDLDADNQDSANASGYLASTGTGGTYMAASGNSVGITSTTGTTSNAGKSLRNLQLPAALRGRIQQQVVTSRKYPLGTAAQRAQAMRDSIMGPPKHIPDRPTMLRKSRSTNTLRLPKREEGSKPGYCENCRIKFDDFNIHIQGRKHRKFAVIDANFLQLDFLLLRVQRRTITQTDVEKGRQCRDDEHDRNFPPSGLGQEALIAKKDDDCALDMCT